MLRIPIVDEAYVNLLPTALEQETFLRILVVLEKLFLDYISHFYLLKHIILILIIFGMDLILNVDVISSQLDLLRKDPSLVWHSSITILCLKRIELRTLSSG